jgi:hypothetical protein
MSYDFLLMLFVALATNHVLIAYFVDHHSQVLSTGQVPAEFAVPKPDANMKHG